jgi:cell division septation protein DedD
LKTFFFILLAANLAIGAWALFLRGDARDAHLVAQQINPEKIRLLGARDKAKLAVAKPAEPPKMLACIEWGGFAASDAAKVEEALAPLAAGTKLTQRRVDDSVGWWVFIPPLANRQAANQKVAELKSLGVDDYFIVNEDPKWRNAIQFGLFKTEEAARARLEQLRAKRVRSAQTGKREGQITRVFFQMRDVPESFAAKLGDMKAMFPGSDVKTCEPENPKAPS